MQIIQRRADIYLKTITLLNYQKGERYEEKHF